MWTIPNIGINSGCQHFIDVKSHLRSAASFVQNQRLAYKLVDIGLEFFQSAQKNKPVVQLSCTAPDLTINH